MKEKIKNRCHIEFECMPGEDCEYRKKTSDGWCEYVCEKDLVYGYCSSKLANINAMVLKLKEEGIVINE